MRFSAGSSTASDAHKHLVNLLAEMEAVGVALVSFSENLDLSTPQGRLMFQIIGAMAEFERSLICERVKAGIAHRKAQGKKVVSV
jgi:DNA invertase Pin-like site-specific DNA recombinase